ncbi:MAG TPA: glycosyltransferase family 4 protein [Pirellulales bacterium]|nr:glycosyltransferase family 4 protein [Pirellulales bacterium]
MEIRVFFTCHDGREAVWDSGFQQPVAWDLPLREGYPFEAVTNTARHPGTHHFWGVQNPDLLQRVLDWRPDAVHVSGYAFASHLRLLRALYHRGVPVLFRGDSHLLSPTPVWKRLAKTMLLRQIFRYPSVFLDVGLHNRQYYQRYGVDSSRLFHCPHSIDVERFRASTERFESEARRWRGELGIGADDLVVLFVGKFEAKKQPVELMRALAQWPDPALVCVLVGDGELRPQVMELAARYPARFRVISFQNQATMPVVYRLGDLLVLPSIRWETWGLAVNEAFACNRPALVSDQVGCAPELIRPGLTGQVFRARDWQDFGDKLRSLTESRDELRARGLAAGELAPGFSTAAAAQAVRKAFRSVLVQRMD